MNQILVGDARETLKEVASQSVHCCVTSPPYWGLRAYVDDPREIGREKTPELHIQNLLEVFREVRRVLRDDGVLWCNYGDVYAGSGKGPTVFSGIGNHTQRQGFDAPDRPELRGYKSKDLLSMPFRVAQALRE